MEKLLRGKGSQLNQATANNRLHTLHREAWARHVIREGHGSDIKLYMKLTPPEKDHPIDPEGDDKIV